MALTMTATNGHHAAATPPKKNGGFRLTYKRSAALLNLLSTHRDRYAKMNADQVLDEVRKALGVPVAEFTVKGMARELGLKFAPRPRVYKAREARPPRPAGNPGGAWYARQKQLEDRLAAALARVERLERELGVSPA